MKTDNLSRNVLVTGCSSGIGRATAVCLAKNGFTVFATVRREPDAENLKRLGIKRLIPMRFFDLAKTEHIPGLSGRLHSI